MGLALCEDFVLLTMVPRGEKNTWNGSIQLGKLQATLRGDH